MMKCKITWRPVLLSLLMGLPAFWETGCSQKRIDRETKADLTIKSKTEIAFAGVNYTIADGVVTLTGNCPTATTKAEVEKRVSEVAGVKKVINHIAIGPVLVNSDFLLKRSADSVLMHTPEAHAEVRDSVVIVKGEVEKKELPELLSGLHHLGAKGIDNQLKVK